MPVATGTVLQLPNPPCTQGWNHNSLQFPLGLFNHGEPPGAAGWNGHELLERWELVTHSERLKASPRQPPP